jgi:hypothetical protein
MAIPMQSGNDDVGVALIAVVTLLLVPAPADPRDLMLNDTVRLVQSQIIIQRTTIVRVPAAPKFPAITPMKWKEKDAPKCIKWSNLAAAMVSSPSTLDLIVKGGTRYRVRLEKSCSAIDFYQGFYVKATQDGQICKDRDSVHSRAGGECGISKFKTLVPDK